MTKYIVLHDFKDLQDVDKKTNKNKKYKAGDTYPDPANKKISKERIEQLTSADNNQERPVIQEVVEEKKVESKTESKTETKTESK